LDQNEIGARQSLDERRWTLSQFLSLYFEIDPFQRNLSVSHRHTKPFTLQTIGEHGKKHSCL